MKYMYIARALPTLEIPQSTIALHPIFVKNLDKAMIFKSTDEGNHRTIERAIPLYM